MNKALLAVTLTLLVLSSLVHTIDLVGAETPGLRDPPTITIHSPENQTSVNNAFLNFSVPKQGQWFAGRTLVSFTYEIDGNLCRRVEVNHNLKYLPFNYSTPIQNITCGIHNLRVNLTYTIVVLESHHVKYQTTDSSFANIYFTLDTTAPSVLIQSVRTQGSNNTLTFTVNEPTMWIGYSLDGMANVTISGNTTIPDIPKGDHTIQVYAADNAGNISASETIQFNTQPFPLALIAIVLATLAIAVGAGLLFYLKKHRKK